ncbi:lipase family protein [Microbulbifer sp. YPW1]|uniref:lipase family protein n=1 Tax=Microbulbifer sp. YPW1 TaxID=2745199 RepID=UPI001599E92C|nr:lipase family protein [Microbulbifer sp. YPW1]QKX16704.1 lipase family protein [Microbulbifer sp. YPW1]
MPELDPNFAARLATGAYAIKNEKTRSAFYTTFKNYLELGEDKKLENKGLVGKTGGILLQTSHMMGVAAEGKSGSEYQDQGIIAIKGTASLMDGLTDLNAGIKSAKTGGMVHQGFLSTFNSFVDQLPQFSPNVHTIHCVGHSLGGALATLTADWLKSNSGKQVKLYTFGSPRVGLEYYAQKTERRLGAGNIYRLYHQTDPVPMVPTWPFFHVPDGGEGDFLLPSGLHLKPWEFHSMARYAKSTRGGDGKPVDWPILKSRRPQDFLDSSIEAWLKSSSIVSFTLNSARLLSAAILWVVKKLTNLLGITVVIAGSTTFTLLDRLAMLMSKGLELAKDVSIWVTRLIKRMAQMLGIVVLEGAEMTMRFIRQVFIQAHHAVSELVRQAGRTLH